MDLSALTPSTILVFLLMLIRISGLILATPLFSQTQIPMQVKVGFMATLTLILYPIYKPAQAVVATDLWQVALLGIQELVIGLIIGFLVRLVFNAVEMAGTLVSQQMGLAMAQSFNPFSQNQSAGMGQLYFILAATLFLTLNVHHTVIVALAKSFELVPLVDGAALIQTNILIERLLVMGSTMFITALLLAFPVFGILITLEVALAYTAKVMPQMNMFIVSLPFKIWIGLVLMLITMPFVMELVGHQFGDLATVLPKLYQFR
ncbi:MAG: flagellar biosynthetic protein FliR [Vampirovibrionales bacterium]